MRRILLTWAAMLALGAALAAGAWAAEATDGPPPRLTAGASLIQADLDRLDQHMADGVGELVGREMDSSGAGRVLTWLRIKETQVIVAATVSPAGRLVLMEPAEFRRHQGEDISGQPQVARMIATGQPQMGRLMKMVEGYWGVDLERPVKDAKGVLAGALSATFHPAPLAEFALQRLPGGEGGFILLQDDGMVLYSREHENIGLNLKTSPRVKANPEMARLLEQVLKSPAGSAVGPALLPTGGQDAPRRRVDWMSVGLHGRMWRLCIPSVAP